VPTMHSTHGLSFRPDYGFFTLRDREADAAINADVAITQASRQVAASTSYEIYVVRAQDGLLVHAEVEVWDTRPDPTVVGGWSSPHRFSLLCPSGELRLGDATGWAIGGIRLPRGAGIYAVELRHRGREEARQALQDLGAAAAQMGSDARLAYFDDRGAGIEQYLFHVWWQSPLPPDEDD